jgi:predicted nucleotidyltransferase
MDFHGIQIADQQLQGLCRKWRIDELSLFGSILRDDFSPSSDVDILVVFAPDAPWSLWDLLDLREELRDLFGRPVDLVEKDALRNPFRRQAILESRRVVYAA